MPEAPDDARDVFAVEAAAGEHGEPLVAPRIRRRDYAAMPEREDAGMRRLAQALFGLRRYLVAQRRTDQANQQIAEDRDHRQLHALAESEMPYIVGIRLGCRLGAQRGNSRAIDRK